MKEHIESILSTKVEHEHRWATGRITYDYSYQSTFVRDGILSVPRTIIVNGHQVLSEGISVSYIDKEVAEKNMRQDLLDSFQGRYV